MIALNVLLTSFGCAAREPAPQPVARRSPLVIVVAPVINLSGKELDTLRVTDIVASEFLSFRDLTVVPVNLTLAALARQGMPRVETPADARALAEEFGADATVVTAVTEYDPYAPPVVGMVMQWYAVTPQARMPQFDPVSASRQSTAPAPELSAAPEPGPQVQVQRVFNAADQAVLEDVRRFARTRPGHRSPYDWRKYVESSELYLRYCTSATIEPMLGVNDRPIAPIVPDEAN